MIVQKDAKLNRAECIFVNKHVCEIQERKKKLLPQLKWRQPQKKDNMKNEDDPNKHKICA